MAVVGESRIALHRELIDLNFVRSKVCLVYFLFFFVLRLFCLLVFE